MATAEDTNIRFGVVDGRVALIVCAPPASYESAFTSYCCSAADTAFVCPPGDQRRTVSLSCGNAMTQDEYW